MRRFLNVCGAAVLIIGFAMQGAMGRMVGVDRVTAQMIGNALAHPDFDAAIDPQARVAQLSAQFLGVPYKAHLLEGSPDAAERLVIDFRGLDCFTYLDYVHALRTSSTYAGFVQSLIRTRYTNGRVSYATRRHFFTDWSTIAPLNAADITQTLSAHAQAVTKYLNQGGSGPVLLPGLPIIKREVDYIPSEFVDNAVLEKLRTGDYIGIYAPSPGLDVTHAGIYVMTEKGPVLRNASFRIANKKVVDSPFIDYVKSVPGIVVLRPI